MQRLAVFLERAVSGLGSFWGGFGLFFVAFCDSSFLSLPEVNDLLVLYFCTRFKEEAYYYALMAVLGSVSGGSVLYWLGKWKGYRFLKRRYPQGRLQSALSVFRRYGVFAVIGPAMLPPPFPFKIFVLSSGVFGLSFPRFLAALFIGRGFRYFFEAVVAVRYGDQAVEYLKENYLQVAGVVLAVALGFLVLYVASGYFRRRQRRAPRVNA
ncbi:MAG: YqaA family protein [Acidobacteriota bacterium]